MPMLDSFFAKSFKPTKCKALLKLTIPRIKLLRNRREVQLRQMRREIAKLLETGQEATARIRVEHILREEKMMAAQEIIELFCELIAVRLPIIEAQRECPVELKEAISSLCFAAPRCSADLPELLQVQLLFAGKYGKEFVSAATELMPECGVNQQLVELLSIRAPAPDIKLKLLKDIAQEHELNWDPSASESELMKLQEDLLTGSPSYASDHKLPLHVENHYATKSTTSTSEPATSHNHSHSAIAVAMVDILEAPKNQRKGRASVSAPEMLRFSAPTVSQVNDQTEPYPSLGNDNLQWNQSGDAMQEKSDKQYVPPTDSPSQSSAHNSPTSVSMPRYNNAELREVLAAAEAAAITAEYAAAKARSAADIAQLRISELAKRWNNQALKSTMENPFHLDRPEADVGEKDGFSFWGTNNNPVNSVAHRAYSDQKGYSDSSPSGCNVFSSHGSPQQQPSMDNEDYFAYPNLFTSESSNLSSPT